VFGIFAKVVRGQSIKSRLRPRLSRQDVEAFYVASLADTLETAFAMDPAPWLFLHGGADRAAVEDLRMRLQSIHFDVTRWEQLRVHTQSGGDLGSRLENAFDVMHARRDPAGGTAPDGAISDACLIVGSDSPSLTPRMLRPGLQALVDPDPQRAADVVLGPATDGGYWCIGLRQPVPGLLQNVAWSTERTLLDTVERCRALRLRVRLLERWTDADHPEDLRTLGRQIRALRSAGDTRCAQHVERVLRRAGYLDAAH